MGVELAEVAAGLPVAASFALAGGITTFREGRRRATLNEAMHELRRPLQVLSLALPAEEREAAPLESSLELATVALERLDREINGSPLAAVATGVSVGELVEAAARRWTSAAAFHGRCLQLHRGEQGARVKGHGFDLSQALDNLLSNAIEHGAGKVEIGWRCEFDRVCISISDEGTSSAANVKVKGRRRRGCRRGHGLRVVSRIARSHGGSFALRCNPDGTEATLRLPIQRRKNER